MGHEDADSDYDVLNNIISLNKYSNKYTLAVIIRRDVAHRSVCLVIVAILSSTLWCFPDECVETHVWSSNVKMSLTIEIASLDDGKFLSMWLPVKR